MALADNELLQSVDVDPTLRAQSDATIPATFALGAGTLEPLTMVAFDTALNFWAPWDNGGANGRDLLKGLVWPKAIVLDAADEVKGSVMIQGRVHRDDIPLNGQLQADVDAELETQARDIGIIVQGLPNYR